MNYWHTGWKRGKNLDARVAELVDAYGSGPYGRLAFKGSSPFPRTIAFFLTCLSSEKVFRDGKTEKFRCSSCANALAQNSIKNRRSQNISNLVYSGSAFLFPKFRASENQMPILSIVNKIYQKSLLFGWVFYFLCFEREVSKCFRKIISSLTELSVQAKAR